jgi:hypothetical protein
VPEGRVAHKPFRLPQGSCGCALRASCASKAEDRSSPSRPVRKGGLIRCGCRRRSRWYPRRVGMSRDLLGDRIDAARSGREGAAISRATASDPRRQYLVDHGGIEQCCAWYRSQSCPALGPCPHRPLGQLILRIAGVDRTVASISATRPAGWPGSGQARPAARRPHRSSIRAKELLVSQQRLTCPVGSSNGPPRSYPNSGRAVQVASRGRTGQSACAASRVPVCTNTKGEQARCYRPVRPQKMGRWDQIATDGHECPVTKTPSRPGDAQMSESGT